MEKAIYRHSTLVILLSHLIYSHATGFDIPKSIAAVFLIGLHAFNKYLEKQEVPDMRAEFSAFKVELNKALEANKKDVEVKVGHIESSLSKYDTFIIKNPNTAAKSIRF